MPCPVSLAPMTVMVVWCSATDVFRIYAKTSTPTMVRG